MNLGQLQQSIQAKGYGNDTEAQQTVAINSVYREIIGQQRWPFLEKQDASLQTIVGQSAYTLPMADWLHLDAVRIEIAAITQYNNLQYLSPQEFRDLEHIDRDVSTPFHWTFYANQLHFYPSPDQVYTVRIDYISQPADLVNSVDVPVLPLAYHDILVWGAISEIAFRERDWLGRQFALQMKEERLKKMDEEYMLRQRQTASHVRSSGYWNTQLPTPFSHEGF